MNVLLATFVGGAFAGWSALAAAQQATPQQKGSAAAYQNPAAQQTAEERAKAAMKAVEKSKTDPKAVKPDVSDPKTLKGAQRLSTSSTNPAEAKANVAASQKQPRTKMPNIKDLTPEERAELKRQLLEQSKP